MNISLWDYYIRLADKIAAKALADIPGKAEWPKLRPQLEREYFKSMGLDPLPDYRSTEFHDGGVWRGQGFQMQRIGWQILPDCWNSACVYRPDPMPADQVPAVLITSGHSSHGTFFSQRHAIMWARRGYISMGFDTFEQGDNPGNHHGLSTNRQDWVSMGFTAAGGELWNSIRALDILEKMPGVDPARIGVTGNSGGGAHSFFLALADARIKVAAPSCGVVRPKYQFDRQHLMTHCDCMFYHNLFQREPIEFAQLFAPRPLLLCFAIEDYLFSPDQYRELYAGIQKFYQHIGHPEKCQLCEYHGPHGYQPESVEQINQWFDKHLYGEQRPPLGLQVPETPESQNNLYKGKSNWVNKASSASTMEIPEPETCFFQGAPPPNNRMALLPELLSLSGTVKLPAQPEEWPPIRRDMVDAIRTNLMQNFDTTTQLELKQLGKWLKGPWDYCKYCAAFGDNEIWVETLTPPNLTGKAVIGLADTTENARDVLMRLSKEIQHTIAVIVPRFAGFNACTTQTIHLLRAGAYTGMTPFMLMLEDLELAMPAVMALPELSNCQAYVYGRGDAGVAALYHTIIHENIAGAILDAIPNSHRDGAYFLNVLRFLDISHAIGLAAPRKIGLVNTAPSRWAKRLYQRLDCPENLSSAASPDEIMRRL